MTCSCAEQIERARTDAAMCAACPSAGWPADRPGSLSFCTVDCKPTAPTRNQPCPKGRHSDEDGTVEWFGLRWYGVPIPIRAYLRVRGWLSRPLAGCGCVKVLKDWYANRLRAV